MHVKWILLVEDNSIDAELTLRSLRSGNAEEEVIVAEDGAKALDCLYRRGDFKTRPAHGPSVVLLDLKMPKVDGLEVLRQIKSDPQLRHIPVVMFTSSREENDLVRCYENGANAYVVKPVAFPQFQAALQQVRGFWLALNERPDESRASFNLRPNVLPQLATMA